MSDLGMSVSYPLLYGDLGMSMNYPLLYGDLGVGVSYPLEYSDSPLKTMIHNGYPGRRWDPWVPSAMVTEYWYVLP